ncbi:MAG: DNA methyltransferase [Gracilimonas sp.]
MNTSIKGLNISNLEDLPVSEFWSNSDSKEDRMHKIHSYPAKFPAFLVSKAVEYATKKNIQIESIGDVFCGCGTTALETRKLNKFFYGWDINPVATLIASVKSEAYQLGRLESYYKGIVKFYNGKEIEVDEYFKNHERINYWFSEKHISDLYKLLIAIRSEVPKGKYQNFFLCAFSNLLKGCSMWLTKSIKPQYDPDKIPSEVFDSFEKQYKSMLKAIPENDELSVNKKTKIKTQNFLKIKEGSIELDLIITSPPYVTSYEYADLHQLSTLWLEHVVDYRELREGTIGSVYHEDVENDFSNLNSIGRDIVSELKIKAKNKAKSVGKYFADMKTAVEKTYSITRKGGMNIFVIGNTSYKGVKVDNAKYLVEVMDEIGFKNIKVKKRKISSKILTPYRDEKGRFSNDSSDRKVYNYEFVITGRKV